MEPDEDLERRLRALHDWALTEPNAVQMPRTASLRRRSRRPVLGRRLVQVCLAVIAVVAVVVTANLLRPTRPPAVPAVAGDALVVDTTVSFRSVNYPDRRIRHRDFIARLEPVVSAVDAADSSFVVRQGLADRRAFSLESLNYPGRFLRVLDGRVELIRDDGTAAFATAATFRVRPGLSGRGVSLVPELDPTLVVRHYGFVVVVMPLPDSELTREDASFLVEEAPPPSAT